MRRILVEFARQRYRQKRGGDAVRVTLSAVDVAQEQRADLVALSDAPSVVCDSLVDRQSFNAAG